MYYIYTRNHHKEENSCWGSTFRKSSVRGSNPKDNSVRGRKPRWEVTFFIDVKGGDIHHIKDKELDA
jgi:hypothetical protein